MENFITGEFIILLCALLGEKGEKECARASGSKVYFPDARLFFGSSGYPGHETGMRKSLRGVMGKDKYDRFFNGFLENFFTEKDAKFFASVRLLLFSLSSPTPSRTRAHLPFGFISSA